MATCCSQQTRDWCEPGRHFKFELTIAARHRLLRAFFWPQKLPIHGLYARVARDSCLPCKRYCRAASHAACRVPCKCSFSLYCWSSRLTESGLGGWWYIIVVVNFDALAQATIFESKGDKLSSSAECRIRTQRVSETQSSADWMPADKPTELSRIKLKNLNSTARPYDQQAFSPPDPTAIWHSHLALAISKL